MDLFENELLDTHNCSFLQDDNISWDMNLKLVEASLTCLLQVFVLFSRPQNVRIDKKTKKRRKICNVQPPLVKIHGVF